MRDKAIRNLYPQVVTINRESDARDAEGDPVVLDESLIVTEVARLNTLPPPKEEQLNTLIVTITSGKRFYADPQSRTDLDGAVLHGFINNAPDTLQENWKTASRPEGADFEIVTFAEMKEASRMALEAKGQIVGVN